MTTRPPYIFLPAIQVGFNPAWMDAILDTLAVQGAPFNIRDFGAVGDHTHDDTAAIQAAAAAARQFGRPMFIPAGDFLIKAPINATSISVIGDNPVSALLLAYASQGFVGSYAMLVDGDHGDGGGSTKMRYESFALVSDSLSAIDGLRVIGNTLFNTFRNIQVRGFTGHGVVLALGSALQWPSGNLFEEIVMNSLGGDGLHATAGWGNKFLLWDIEAIGGIGMNLGAGGGTVIRRCEIDQCWMEDLGQGVDGVFMSACEECQITRTLVSGYGTTPATTGNGIHLVGCNDCVIDTFDISGRAASAVGSRKIYIDSGLGNRIADVANLTPTDIEVKAATTAVDTIMVGARSDSRVGNGPQVVTSNAHTALAAAGATRYLQLMTGWDSATETDCSIRVSGRVSFLGMHIVCTDPGSGGGGQSYTVTLMKNGVATAMSINLSTGTAPDASDTTHAVDCVDGDLVSIRVASTAAANAIARGQLKVAIGQRN